MGFGAVPQQEAMDPPLVYAMLFYHQVCRVHTQLVVTQVADFPLNIPELGPCQTPLDHQRHPVGLLEFPALHGPLDRLESIPTVRHVTRPQDAGVLPRLMFTFLF